MCAVGPVVVGISESSSDDLALEWGIEQARATGAELRLVCAYRWALSYPWELTYADVQAPELTDLRKHAERLLRQAGERATGLAPELTIQSEAVDGDPMGVLIAESRQAAILVLGSRRLKTLESVVLGSVAAAVAPRAHCPVVVLRAPVSAEPAAVVVGVDGGEGSEAVLAFAFAHASSHRLPLTAALCWESGRLATAPWRHQQPSSELAGAWLSEALAGWREKYPDVRVRTAVLSDHPVPGLVGSSRGQSLLVVGTRGRRALTGTLLGSVSQGVLHHALCPVAVVPSHHD